MISLITIPIQLFLVVGFSLVLLAMLYAFCSAGVPSRTGMLFAARVEHHNLSTPDVQRSIAVYLHSLRLITVTAVLINIAGLVGQRMMILTVPLAILTQVGGSGWALAKARRRMVPYGGSAALRTSAALVEQPAFDFFAGWSLLPLLLLAGAACLLAYRWDKIPSIYATHWDVSGHADRWHSKTVLHVATPLLAGLSQCAAITFLGWLIRWRSRPTRLSISSAQLRFRQLLLGVLVATEVFLAAVFSCVALLPAWTTDRPGIFSVAWIAFLALILIAFAIYLLARSLPAATDDPTPDRCWHWGIFYVNPNDPAIFVLRRFGVGYTLNLGNPQAWFSMGLVLLLSIGGMMLPNLVPDAKTAAISSNR